jgi:hypothetical protein
MTPEDEQEAQYADGLHEQLPQDERDLLLTAWSQYLFDREQRDLLVRHRDFALGWIACYDAHELRPKKYVVKRLPADEQPAPPVPSARRAMVWGQKPTHDTITVVVRDEPAENG